MKMKPQYIAIILFFLIPALVIAGTISGVIKKDHVAYQGAFVSCYLYNGAVSNVSVGAAVDTDTSGADGSFSLTTANTQTHIVKIIDPNNVKQGEVHIWTPE